jgi:hypothetical protein
MGRIAADLGCSSFREEPKVRRLFAGGRWIRTIGSWCEGAGFFMRKANCGGSNGGGLLKLFLLRGTDGSNPSPSSGESDANLTSSIARLPPVAAPVCHHSRPLSRRE